MIGVKEINKPREKQIIPLASASLSGMPRIKFEVTGLVQGTINFYLRTNKEVSSSGSTQFRMPHASA